MFKIATAALLSLASVARAQNAVFDLDDNGCVVDFTPGTDYFPVKYEKPSITSYGDVDIFGEKFVPNNTTDFLDIQYFDTYKIVTNKHQDPPKSYLLYQCGTEPPQDVIDGGNFDLVTSVPHKGGLALTQTPQIPYIELLGLREEVIAYIGNPIYVTSPCLSHMLGDDATPGFEVETVYSTNFTVQPQLVDEFRARNPDAIIVSGPTNNVVGDRVIVASATQERTNVATFDWIAFYAAFYNLEGESNRIAREFQDSYDCSSAVARDIAAQQRTLEEETEKPVLLWANYISYENLGWSVAECPTWDAAYNCEYAAHCDAEILSRPEGVGINRTFGSPTVYWYLNDEQFLEMGKDADYFIFTGGNWDEIYALKNATLDQIKAVQNQEVYDTLGQGPSAWFEQRYAEYDVVGLDLCEVVGRTSDTGRERRWFRNVYTEPVGSLDSCNVPEELSQPFVPPGQECTLPGSSVVAEDDSDSASTVASFSKLVALVLAMASFSVSA